MKDAVVILFWVAILAGVWWLSRWSEKSDAKKAGVSLAEWKAGAQQRLADEQEHWEQVARHAETTPVEPVRPVRPVKQAEMSPAAALLSCVLFLGGILYGAFWVIDSAGYVSHTRTVAIDVNAKWLVGETKQCASYVQDSKFNSVSCGLSDETKQMQVEFYGRMEQPEYRAVQWDCRRLSQSFICQQTGGTR